MQLGSSLEADSRLARQEIIRLLWEQKGLLDHHMFLFWATSIF